MSLIPPRKGYKSVPWLFGKEIEIPEEWEVKFLKETSSVRGRVGWKGYTQEDFVEEGKGAISLGANNISNIKSACHEPYNLFYYVRIYLRIY